MKLKKIFVIAVLLLAVFLIYLTTMDKKVYYLALGDAIALKEGKAYPLYVTEYLKEKKILEEYRSEFLEDDLRITDLIRNIEDNKKVTVDNKEKTIKNALIKADLVTLSVGNEELFYKMKTEKPNRLYDYIDEMMEDMEKLLKLIREYCKEDIFVLGYFNPASNQMNEYIKYANQKLEKIIKKYEMIYVDLQKLNQEKDMTNELGLTSEGQKTVAELVIPMIEKRVIGDEK